MTDLRSLVVKNGTTQGITSADTLIVGDKVDAASGSVLTIGGTNATGITVGQASITTSFPGPVELTGDVTTVGGTTFTSDATFEGNVTLGNGPSDTVTFASTTTVIGNIAFNGAGYKVTNLLDPTAGSQEAATAKWVEDQIAAIPQTPPGAPADSIQFNDGAGGFGGSANLTWSGTDLDVTGAVNIKGGDPRALTIQDVAASTDILFYDAAVEELTIQSSVSTAVTTIGAGQNNISDTGHTAQLSVVPASSVALDFVVPVASSVVPAIIVKDGAAAPAPLKLDASEIDVNSVKIVNVADGVNPNDAVNFSQLSAIVSGVSAVSATAPLLSSGGPTPDISIDTAGASNGDVLTFNAGAWAAAAPADVNVGSTFVAVGDGTGITGSNSLTFAAGELGVSATDPVVSVSRSDVGNAVAIIRPQSVEFSVPAAVAAFATVKASDAVSPIPLKLDASELDVDSVKIVNVSDGVDPNDAVNKSQLDALVVGVSAVSATAPLLSSGGPTPDISIDTAGAASGDVLTFNGTAWAAAAPEPGAVFAGALTIYVDPVNGTDAPGGGTLGQPYASINYAYSQVPSLGAPSNTVYNAQVGQFVTEKLVFQLAPGRYVGDVTLGFKRARVQLIGNGVQIVGNVTLAAVRADFPASSMEALKASFPAPWTNAGALTTFEITGAVGGGVEADATSDPLLVTGLSTLLFNEPTLPGSGLGTNWDNNYGQFNFYANRANLIGGQVIATAYTVPTTNGLPTSVIEIDGCTIGEASSPVRSYLGAVPYAYLASPSTWSTGTVGTTNKAPAGVITLKCHNSTLGAALGPRLTIGEIDGCRIYDIDRTMLGTVDNGAVTGSTSTSYLGMVINQFRVYSGAGIPASQYQIGSSSSGARYKMDSTSYTTLAFSRNSSGVLTARTLNLPTSSGTATAGAAATITDTSKAFTTNQWAGGTITLTGGTGSGQTRTISSNTATAITVSPAWTTPPAAGTTYTVSALVAFDLLDDSRSLAYTPTTPAQWLDPDPTTVGSALDKVGALGLLSAAPANGQIPIGNGTNFTPATISAGSGVSITNGAGTITIAATGSGGTVTSVDVSGGTTGLTFSGGPIVGAGTITMAGTLDVDNGGTGATSLTGYVKGSGTSAFTASATIPGSDVSGDISGNAANVTGTVAVGNGGTGQSTLTSGALVVGNGASAVNTLSPGSNGQVLTVVGGAWAASSLPAATDYSVVSITTAVSQGDAITVAGAAAIATAAASARVAGMVSATANKVSVLGIIEDCNFEGGLTLAIGEAVYLSASSAGKLTNVAPSASGEVVAELGIIAIVNAAGGGAAAADVLWQPKSIVVL